jgi:hypothetical protein
MHSTRLLAVKGSFRRTAAIVVAALSLIVVLCVVTCRYISQMPNPSVNYAAKLNEEFGTSDGPNAADFYRKAMSILEVPPVGFLLAQESTEPDLSTEIFKKNGPVHPLVVEWLERNREPFDISEQAAMIDRCWVDEAVLDPAGRPDSRILGELQFLYAGWMKRARLAAGEGDTVEAVRCYVRALRIIEHRHQIAGMFWIPLFEESRVHQMWLDICWDFPSLWERPLPKQLQRMASAANASRIIRTVEFVLLDEIQRLFSDDGSGDGHFTPEQNPQHPIELLRNLQGLVRPSRREVTGKVERHFGHIRQAMAEAAGAARDAKLDRLVMAWDDLANSDRGVTLLASGQISGSRPLAFAADTQSIRVGVVRAWQVLEHQRRTGKLPDNLEDLGPVKDYADPGIGVSNLNYVKDGERFKIDSTGLPSMNIWPPDEGD